MAAGHDRPVARLRGLKVSAPILSASSQYCRRRRRKEIMLRQSTTYAHGKRSGSRKRFLTISYGAANYLIFLAAFLYAIGFVGNIWVPRSIDAGVAAPIGEAVTVNVLLLGLFAVQHSVMARPAFKRWWTRFVNPSIERSTYVLLASLVLFLLYWQWRTMPAVVWDVTSSEGRAALETLFWLGWAAG